NQRYAGYETGLDRGFIHYEDYLVSLGQVLRSTWFGQTTMLSGALRAHSAREAWRAVRSLNLWVDGNRDFDPRIAPNVTDAFLRWHADGARASEPPRPWFAFLNYFDAHTPLDPPAPFDTMFSSKRTTRDLYDGAIRYLDTEVDRLLRELRRRGALDNTIVIVTADHGELLGEHKLEGHSHNLYLQSLHVPLVFRFPRRVPA